MVRAVRVHAFLCENPETSEQCKAEVDAFIPALAIVAILWAILHTWVLRRAKPRGWVPIAVAAWIGLLLFAPVLLTSGFDDLGGAPLVASFAGWMWGLTFSIVVWRKVRKVQPQRPSFDGESREHPMVLLVVIAVFAPLLGVLFVYPISSIFAG